jgi:hypothetical protein
VCPQAPSQLYYSSIGKKKLLHELGPSIGKFDKKPPNSSQRVENFVAIQIALTLQVELSGNTTTFPLVLTSRRLTLPFSEHTPQGPHHQPLPMIALTPC